VPIIEFAATIACGTCAVGGGFALFSCFVTGLRGYPSRPRGGAPDGCCSIPKICIAQRRGNSSAEGMTLLYAGSPSKRRLGARRFGCCWRALESFGERAGVDYVKRDLAHFEVQVLACLAQEVERSLSGDPSLGHENPDSGPDVAVAA
jgi:hypothetical protein